MSCFGGKLKERCKQNVPTFASVHFLREAPFQREIRKVVNILSKSMEADHQVGQPTEKDIAQTHERIKQIEQMFSGLENNPQLLELMPTEKVMEICHILQHFLSMSSNNPELITKTLAQKTAVTLKAILKSKSSHFTSIAPIYYGIVTDFKIDPSVKAILEDSLYSFILKYQTELGNLFEKTVSVLVQLVQTLTAQPAINPTEYSAPPITISTLSQPLTFTLEWPTQAANIFSTIMMMGEIFVGNEQHPNLEYKGELASLFRKLNKLLINEEVLTLRPSLIDELLDFWLKIINESYDVDCLPSQNRSLSDEENDDKIRRMAGAEQMKQWPQFYDQLQLILNFSSPSKTQNGILLHNYLETEQNWEQHSVFLTKSKAAEIAQTLLMILASGNSKQKEKIKHHREFVIVAGGSILWSLESILSGSHLRLKNLQTCRSIIDLYSAIILVLPDLYSFQQMAHILVTVILPILSIYLNESKDLFAEDTQEFQLEISSCCEDHSRETVLCKLAKLIENVCDQFMEMPAFLLQLIRYSLEETQNAGFEVWPVPELIRNSKATDTQTALLLLGIVSYKMRQIIQFKQSIVRIVVPPFIQQLDPFQRALLYNALAYIFEQLYFQDESLREYILQSTLQQSVVQVRHFTIQFLYSIDTHLFSLSFISNFLEQFMTMGDIENKWTVLKRMVADRLKDFNEDQLLSLMASIKEEILRQGERSVYLMKQGKSYKIGDFLSLLYFCQNIVSDYEYCFRHPTVQNMMWSVVDYFHLAIELNCDDVMVKLVVELLEPPSSLPSNFQLIVQTLLGGFAGQEYSGNIYFSFIETAIKRCRGCPSTLQMLYSALTGALSYSVYYPEEHTLPLLISMNNSILGLQCFFITYLPLLAPIQIQEIQRLYMYAVQTMEQLKRYPVIHARFYLLYLLTQRASGSAINLPQIVNMASQRIFIKYESMLLLYLLREFLTSIPPEEKHLIFTIIVYCARNQKHPIKSQLEENKQFDAILSYVERPVKLEDNLKKQAESLLASFRQTQKEEYQRAFTRLGHQDLTALESVLAPTPAPRKIIKMFKPRANAMEFENELKPFVRPRFQSESEEQWGPCKKRGSEREMSKQQILNLKREKKNM